MLQAPRKVMVGVREGHDGHDVTVSGRCVFVCFGCWEGKVLIKNQGRQRKF